MGRSACKRNRYKLFYNKLKIQTIIKNKNTMRLQNKSFTFQLPSGDKPISRILTSNLVIDNKLTNILVSELFYGIKKERANTIKGYSILEFVNSKGEIQINERVYSLTFTGDKDNFNITSINDPTDFVLKDKDFEIEMLEKRIQESAPSLQSQEQPLDKQTIIERQLDEAGNILHTNEDYQEELKDLQQDGFVEYNTLVKSNMRLLVNESDENSDLILIEIFADDFAILINDEYEIKTNTDSKTFEYIKK